MNINELKKEITGNMIRGVYFFHGTCDYLISYYANLIREKLEIDDFNFFMFDKMDIEQASMLIETPPAFDGKKLLIYKNSGFLTSSKAEERDFWCENFLNFPEYVTVIFIDESIDNRYKKLISSAEAVGAVVEFVNLTPQQLRAWINILIKERGKNIDGKTIDYFIANCSHDMYIIESEVNKLCNFAADLITPDDIDECVAKPVENRIYELSAAILYKNPSKAFAILCDLQKLREKPTGIMALVCANFCNICKIKMSKKENVNWQALGLRSPYSLKYLEADAAKTTVERIQKLVEYALMYDSMLKSSAVDKWLVLEMFTGKAML